MAVKEVDVSDEVSALSTRMFDALTPVVDGQNQQVACLALGTVLLSVICAMDEKRDTLAMLKRITEMAEEVRHSVASGSFETRLEARKREIN